MAHPALSRPRVGVPTPRPPAHRRPRDKARRRQPPGTLGPRMEQTRADPTRASCHAFLDPVGFAFEHVDAVGHWRDKDNNEPIDASGQLVTGQKFDGAEALRKLGKVGTNFPDQHLDIHGTESGHRCEVHTQNALQLSTSFEGGRRARCSL